MANTIIPRDIADLGDEELIALCEEPETLLELSPLERELIIRLGAELEVHQAMEKDLQGEMDRLDMLLPTRTRKARQKAAKAQLDAIIAEAEEIAKLHPKVIVRIGD